ncbi:MAG: CDP-glycerol glycerophosphotransferase family protein [Melioribacteraceae bacterium]|nr:CDP-glycerol glycerophosphotransferase family protein [Melioribacteraceae bacterium]
MYLHIGKYLPDVKIIAKNSKTRKYFDNKGIDFLRMPSFPKLVIMGRQTPYKFPVEEIIKIGFDHGLYQFKRWTSPKNYNGFDIYFVSSNNQVETAKSMGINSTYAVGYPKLDNAFNGFYDEKFLNNIKDKKNLDSNKKTIIFTATWDVAGLSAIDKWIDRIEELNNKYNILVTVHTWTKEVHKEKLRSSNKIVFIEEFDPTPYLMLADVFVGDYSSIIGDFCSLNKPIITFRVPKSDRTINEIDELIKSISVQVDNFDELKNAIDISLENPGNKSEERKKANRILFYKLDGKAGERAAEQIKKYFNKS